MTNEKYTIADVGCYMDDSIRDDNDILEFMMNHGFEPEDVTKEFIDEVLNDGLDYLNENWVDETVYFTFNGGDLVLLPIDEDE
jgi:hypothetical protein